MMLVAAALDLDAALEEQEHLGRDLEDLVRAHAMVTPAKLFDPSIERCRHPGGFALVGVLQHTVDEMAVRAERDRPRAVANRHPERLVERVRHRRPLERAAELA